MRMIIGKFSRNFAVELAGTLDLDAELKIWITVSNVPIQKTFNKSSNIFKVQSVLAKCVLSVLL